MTLTRGEWARVEWCSSTEEFDVAGLAALAVEADGALAGRQPHVVDVEPDHLGDAGAGVERGQCQVPGRRAGVGRAASG